MNSAHVVISSASSVTRPKRSSRPHVQRRRRKKERRRRWLSDESASALSLSSPAAMRLWRLDARTAAAYAATAARLRLASATLAAVAAADGWPAFRSTSLLPSLLWALGAGSESAPATAQTHTETK